MLAAPHGHVAPQPLGRNDMHTRCSRIPDSAAVGCRGCAVAGTSLLTRVVRVARTRPCSFTRSAMPLDHREQTDSELSEFVASVASRPSDRTRRANFIRRVEEMVKEALGSDAKILVYGSCFTDTGESNADIDATIYVPMTCRRAQSRSSPLAQRRQMLREVVSRCRLSGLEVIESRHAAGTVTVQESVSVHVTSNTFRSYPTVRCILSCQRLMPLYSSHLIRAYVQLDGRLKSLILALKHWARAAGVLKKQDGFVPSYVISLMAIYYAQVCHQLPSLHQLAKSSRLGGFEVEHFDTEFFTFKDVGSVEFAGRDSAATAGFLLGCFDFFNTRFDWTNEVVSVRMGQRCTTDAACFRNLWGKGQTGFHVEDPIELGRNATAGIRPEIVQQLRSALAKCQCQRSQCSLAELLCPDGSPLPTADPCQIQMMMQPKEHFEMADLEHGTHVCMICGAQYNDAWLLRQHQVDLAHFNTDKPEELVLGRKREEMTRSHTLRRLQDEISGVSFE